MKKLNITDRKGGAAITVHVLTRTSKSEIAGVLDDGTLKVKLNAPPLEGKANKELIKLLAKEFNIPKSSIEIVAGKNSKQKIVALIGITPDEVNKQIGKILSKK